jgi:hypothetical protein
MRCVRRYVIGLHVYKHNGINYINLKVVNYYIKYLNIKSQNTRSEYTGRRAIIEKETIKM